MPYIKESIVYIKKYFFSLLIYSIVPGVILGLISNPISIYEFLATDYLKKGNLTFVDLYKGMTDITDWKKALGMFLGISIVIIFLAVLSGTIERHFRLGEFSHKHFFKNVNTSFLPLFIAFIVLILLLELYGVIIVVFAFLWRSILYDNLYAAFALTLICVILFFISLFMIVAKLMLAVPYKIATGLPYRNAILDVFDTVQGKKFWRIFLSITVPVVPIYALMILLAHFVPSEKFFVITFPIMIIVYSFASIYYIVLAFVEYFDCFNLEREDKKSKWRKAVWF